MPNLKPYAGLARAPFLILPITLVVCGTGASAFDGSLNWGSAALAMVGLVALHIAVNALNEWSDMRKGIDLKTVRTPFSGGSGTLPAGEASLKAALIFGLTTAAVGLAIGIWFLLQVGLVFLPFMLVGGFLALGYTDALARIGLGEIAAGLGLGGLAISGTALVQSGTLGAAAVAASIPAFLMTFNLLLLNEFPDEEADREGGRKNLVLLLGRKGAAMVYAGAGLLVPVAIIGAVVAGYFPTLALIAVLPSLLLVAPVRWAFGNPAEAVPIPALGSNVIWNLATNTLLGAGLFLATIF